MITLEKCKDPLCEVRYPKEDGDPNTVPGWFRTMLEGLPNVRKNELWIWLDGNPTAVRELIECVGREDGEDWLAYEEGPGYAEEADTSWKDVRQDTPQATVDSTRKAITETFNELYTAIDHLKVAIEATIENDQKSKEFRNIVEQEGLSPDPTGKDTLYRGY